jgi:hypothetical protein
MCHVSSSSTESILTVHPSCVRLHVWVMLPWFCRLFNFFFTNRFAIDGLLGIPMACILCLWSVCLLLFDYTIIDFTIVVWSLVDSHISCHTS